MTSARSEPSSTPVSEAEVEPADGAATDGAATGDATTARRPRAASLKRLVALVGVAVAVAGALWTFYEIKAEFFANTSGYSSLVLAAEPYPESASEWAVPTTTDFGSFPPSNGTCGNEQEAWLSAHGDRITTHVMLDMRNTASEGAMLVVKDISLPGGREVADEVRLRVICNSAPTSTVVLRSARLDASTEDGVAVLSASTFGATAEGLPDTPVAWNLAPGETGQLLVRVVAMNQVEGTLVATVLSGESAQVVEIEGGDVRVRPLVDSGLTYLNAGENLRCITELDGELTDCTVEDVLAASAGDE